MALRVILRVWASAILPWMAPPEFSCCPPHGIKFLRLRELRIADTEELWRRVAFSILITNADDHLRNHGFLHLDRGQWRLAPAFDINPFPARARELKTWVSEESGPEATIQALMSVRSYFRIPLPRARAILGEVEHVVSQWRTLGRGRGMSTRELDQFADAFEHCECVAARTACF